MNKLKIPENHSGVSKTLRLPENIVEDVQNLANLKNLSFNKTIISIITYNIHYFLTVIAKPSPIFK